MKALLKNRLALGILAVGMVLTVTAGTSLADHHGGRVVVYGGCPTYIYAQPVYVAPAPVVYAPATVVVTPAPAPVYVAPAPVYVAPAPFVYVRPSHRFSFWFGW